MSPLYIIIFCLFFCSLLLIQLAIIFLICFRRREKRSSSEIQGEDDILLHIQSNFGIYDIDKEELQFSEFLKKSSLNLEIAIMRQCYGKY